MPLSVNSFSPVNEHSPGAPSSFPVPPHLMGRNVENPANEPGYSGRRLQKPRFGVRVPYRNLTSQIVTQEEIAQEILQRAMKKNVTPSSSAAIPECTRASGESIFAINAMTRHLAKRLSSPSKDLEVMCHRNTADLRAKVQAELNSCSVKLEVNLPGSPSGIKQSAKEAQIAGLVDSTATTPHSSPLFSPRIKLQMAKLDKDIEREMALKQLKELPMIKGRSGEIVGDSPVSRSTKRALNYSGSVSVQNPSSLRNDVKKDESVVYHGDSCSSSCSTMSSVVQLHKLDCLSSLKDDNIISNNVQVDAVSPLKQVKSDVSCLDKMTQCKYAKTDKVFPKESKLRMNKSFHSKLSKGQHRYRHIKKRRSARLNIPCEKEEVNSVDTDSNLNIAKKKPKKKKKVNISISANYNGNVEEAGKLPLGDGIVNNECCDSNSPSNLKNGSAPEFFQDIKVERISALKCSSNPDIHSTKETRERVASLCKTGVNENSLDDLSTDKSQREPKKATGPLKSRELDKLLMDEGALNMILETSPLIACTGKPRRKPTNRKLMKAIKKENITVKTNLAKKHVLQNLKSSKPKLRLTKDKASSSVEVIDLRHSPPKKVSTSKVTAKTPQNSSEVRRHSSIEPVSVVVENKPLDSASKNVASCKENGEVNLTTVKEEESIDKVQLVNVECIGIAQVKTPLNSNKQNVFRFSSVKRPVTIPRMSNSVRMKLNSEMSKNFLKGLNIENSKYVPLKALKTKKSCLNPVKSTSSINPVLVMNKDVRLSVSPQLVTTGSVSSNVAKRMKISHDKELPSSLPNHDKADASIHNKQEDTICNTHAIPEALPAPSILSTELPAVGAKAVPKVKKDTNVVTLETLIDQEHRILTVPLSPIASSYSNITKGLKVVSPKYKKKSAKHDKQLESKECPRQRFSWRQNAGTFSYKEICLRRYENFVQIILAPCSTVMKNSLNVQVLHEFQDALQQLRRDRNCRVVLVTSTGSTFCQGIDLHSLIHVNVEHRKKAAEQLSKAIREFMKTLAMFNKPIVAGVHGASVGLGVTMLPFFDVVYASDKATFHTPYARLGQVPEGAAVLTLPLLLGNAVTSELLFGSRRLTATEAVHHGLVTRVLWPDKFQEELIPNVEAIANQSSQAMESMKALLRLNLRVKLDATLDSESTLLIQHWCSPECQRNFRKFLETSDDVLFQRQKKDRI